MREKEELLLRRWRAMSPGEKIERAMELSELTLEIRRARLERDLDEEHPGQGL
jgi:hypothetical protein